MTALRSGGRTRGPQPPAARRAPPPFARERRRRSVVADGVKKIELKQVLQRYQRKLRQYAIIDPATAFCIKTMRAQRKLAGRIAFVVPYGTATKTYDVDGGAIGNGLPSGVSKEVYNAAFEKALKEAGDEVNPSRPIPMLVLKATYKNESGLRHLNRDVGLERVALYGCDWANLENPFTVDSKGKAHRQGARAGTFDEVETNPRRGDISSRGWGLSVYTVWGEGLQWENGYYSLEPDNKTLGDYSNDPSPFPDYTRGLPAPRTFAKYYPAHIVSMKSSLKAGLRIFQANFAVSRHKRDCTFEADRHNCRKCLARLSANDVSMVGSTTYAVSESGYRKIVRDYSDEMRVKLSTLEEDMQLVEDESKTIPVEKRVEMPCSWLTTRMRYAGAGAEAFGYIQQIINFLASGAI